MFWKQNHKINTNFLSHTLFSILLIVTRFYNIMILILNFIVYWKKISILRKKNLLEQHNNAIAKYK